MLMSGVNIAFPTDSKNRGEIARASVGKYVVTSWEKLDLSEAHRLSMSGSRPAISLNAAKVGSPGTREQRKYGVSGIPRFGANASSHSALNVPHVLRLNT